MKTSNKILVVLGGVTGVILLIFYLCFKPEYKRSALRNIADQYKVISIEDDMLDAGEVLFTEAQSREESYAYYEKGDCRLAPWQKTSGDTLFIVRPTSSFAPAIKQGTPLHLHLKGVDEVVLGDKVIYKR